MNQRLVKAACLFLFLVSCATPQTRHREGDNRGQETSITVQDEKNMTAELLPEMRKDYPPVQDKRLQAYVSALGHKLVAASNLQGHPYEYTFTVVDVDYVNAFALPAGTVFVTAPLINMAENEAELAGVIGHEIGHVVARHTAERMDQAKKNESKNLFYTVGAGILGGAAGYAVGKSLCKQGDVECLKKAALAGAAVGAGGSLLIQKYKFMANSREDEMEADRIGFRVATRAGYAPDHVGTFYEKLLQMEKKSGEQNALMKSLSDVMSTHPPSAERVQQMKEMAVKAGPRPKATVSSNEFSLAKQEVVQFLSEKKSKTN